jgi:hypothetical protein
MATVKQLQVLFTKLGIEKQQRHQRIHAWTSGRTNSSQELHSDELQELCNTFSNEWKRKTEALQDEKQLIISGILNLAEKTGIKQPGDYGSFNHFMLYKSVVKKDLPLCNLEELRLVLEQFRALKHNNDKSAQNAGTKAFFNQLGMPNISKN